MRARCHARRGFTLVEMIIGIVVFSISLSIITGWVAPLTRQSVEPILQVRATELAQSLLNEISAKSFDEHSDRATGQIRCNEDLDGSGTLEDFPGESLCTAQGLLGPDGEETREHFDDVDDYDGLLLPGPLISNSLGQFLNIDGQNLYEGFTARVEVAYDNGYLPLADGGQLRKRITVTITTPLRQQLLFTRYRSNF